MAEIYVVTKVARAANDIARAEAVLLRPKNRGIEWTAGALHDALVIIGLDYTDDETKLLIEYLLKRGIIEAVPQIIVEPVPAPAPEPVPVVEVTPK